MSLSGHGANYDPQNRDYGFQGQGQGPSYYTNDSGKHFMPPNSQNFSMERLFSTVESISHDVKSIKDTVRNVEHRQDMMGNQLDQVSNEQKAVNARLKHIENREAGIRAEIEQERVKSIKQSIRIYNYDAGGAQTDADIRKHFLTFCESKLLFKLEPCEINRVRWVGRGPGKALVIDLLSWLSKMNIFANLKNLRNTDPHKKVSIKDELTEIEYQKEKANYPIFKRREFHTSSEKRDDATEEEEEEDAGVKEDDERREKEERREKREDATYDEEEEEEAGVTKDDARGEKEERSEKREDATDDEDEEGSE